MAKTKSFDGNYERYENWFDENKWVYMSELNAVKYFIPKNKKGIEVGVGTGRFAGPLGIKIGIEPSENMKKISETKGIKVINATGENIPFEDSSFDFALMVNTICFLDNIKKTFLEIKRILKERGSIIIGFVDRDTPLGKVYQKVKNKNVFYKDATFYSAKEIIEILEKLGFVDIETVQTIFSNNLKMDRVENYKEGYGDGGFTVIKAISCK